jgi:hypothetical protein
MENTGRFQIRQIDNKSIVLSTELILVATEGLKRWRQFDALRHRRVVGGRSHDRLMPGRREPDLNRQTPSTGIASMTVARIIASIFRGAG